MKVLLIEDDRTLADYVAKGLREGGHVVDICRDGKAGLYSAAEQDHDVVLLDRMLPGVDGITILQTMRAANNLTPVLILTALGEVDDRVEGLRKGGDDYLSKPFSLQELIARVEALGRWPRYAKETVAVNADVLQVMVHPAARGRALARRSARSRPSTRSSRTTWPRSCG